MLSNETVHMVTDGNDNGNRIIVKWVVDPFCDSNGNRNAKYTHICNFFVAIAVAVSHHVNSLI